MKQISLSQAKIMKKDDYKETGCFELVSDGEHLAYVIVGAEQEMKERIQVNAGLINAAKGIT